MWLWKDSSCGSSFILWEPRWSSQSLAGGSGDDDGDDGDGGDDSDGDDGGSQLHSLRWSS